jgi:glucose-6-phosphate isomerase
MRSILHFNSNYDKSILDKIKKEKQSIGYYDLVDQDVNNIIDFAYRDFHKHIVVIGIGGSSLGTNAIYHFLKQEREFSKTLMFLDSTDPLMITRKLNKINIKKTLFIIISKSGTTLETIAILKYLHTIYPINSKDYVVISDKGSKLEKMANHYSLPVFNLPISVGGRFSVFSSVGLLPLALMGINIKALLEGAKTIKEEFFNQDYYYNSIMEKASYYVKNKDQYAINVIFSYSEGLREFNAWLVQLWGESLGKINSKGEQVGLTPIGIIGPTDQHSFLQLILEGVRNKTVTFIKINNFNNSLRIPNITLPFLEELDSINGYSFEEIINMQADSTLEAMQNSGNIPLDLITLDCVKEEDIGKLIYYYELLTSVSAKILEINCYDQPGVELGKTILKKKLGV